MIIVREPTSGSPRPLTSTPWLLRFRANLRLVPDRAITQSSVQLPSVNTQQKVTQTLSKCLIGDATNGRESRV